MFFSIQQENQLTFLFRSAQRGICEGWSPMKVAIKKTVQKQTAELSLVCYMVGNNLFLRFL